MTRDTEACVSVFKQVIFQIQEGRSGVFTRGAACPPCFVHLPVLCVAPSNILF